MPQGELPLIPHEVQDRLIYQRAVDGYINATAMCQAAGKAFADYARLVNTKAFAQALQADMGIPIAELIQVVRGGYSDEQGTWVHPQVAIPSGPVAFAGIRGASQQMGFRVAERPSRTASPSAGSRAPLSSQSPEDSRRPLLDAGSDDSAPARPVRGSWLHSPRQPHARHCPWEDVFPVASRHGARTPRASRHIGTNFSTIARPLTHGSIRTG